MRGEPLVVVEPVRQFHQLSHVELGQLALEQRFLQVQFGVTRRLALALFAPRLPVTNNKRLTVRGMMNFKRGVNLSLLCRLRRLSSA